MQKTPRMLRPMLFLGILAIIVAAALWSANPQWQQNVLAILILGAGFLLGLFAVITDLVSFGRDIQKLKNSDRE